ncbi:MAG: four helix bundle protein [Phycisphaeraceae bacterium]
MTGRLQEATLLRFVDYGSRVLSVADQLEQKNRSRRVVDQLIGSGTSAGANAFEASEGISKREFLKCIGITAKELNETRYWLLLISKVRWIPDERLAPLLAETLELLAIVKAIIVRTRKRTD